MHEQSFYGEQDFLFEIIKISQVINHLSINHSLKVTRMIHPNVTRKVNVCLKPFPISMSDKRLPFLSKGITEINQ